MAQSSDIPITSILLQEENDSFFILRSGVLVQVPMLKVCCCTSRQWGESVAGCVAYPEAGTSLASMPLPTSASGSRNLTAASTSGVHDEISKSRSRRKKSGATDQTTNQTAVNCHVCGDPLKIKRKTCRSTTACHSCRVFFSRHCKKKIPFTCSAGDNSCQITPITRISCRACRMERCKAAGMQIWTSARVVAQKDDQAGAGLPRDLSPSIPILPPTYADSVPMGDE